MQAALIGLGMVADMHVAAIAATGGQVGLRGVFARRAQATAAFAERHGVRPYATLAEVAVDPEVDFVILATPPDARLEAVKLLADAGKPILMEKPIERDLPTARALVEMCEAQNVPLGVVFQHRMRPAARQLAALDLGPIASVEVSVPWWRDAGYYASPGRGTYARDGGGVLITQAIHTLDLMLHLCGPVAAVQALCASTSLHDIEAEDFASAGMVFRSGAVGSMMASTASFPGRGEQIVINAQNASAVLNAAELTIYHQDGRVEQIGAAAATGGGADPMAFTADWHRDVIADFAQALRDRRAPAITGRDALGVHALIDAIQTSSRTGAKTQVKQDPYDD